MQYGWVDFDQPCWILLLHGFLVGDGIRIDCTRLSETHNKKISFYWLFFIHSQVSGLLIAVFT